MKKKIHLSRRHLLMFSSCLVVTGPLMALSDKNPIDIYVVKNAQCGCCNAWIKILTDEGFNVITENRSADSLAQFKVESGIPKDMMSCHTAIVGNYFIEGHVPANDIKRLIAELPDALGLAVPSMPYGSPGMGPEEEREAYDVFIVSNEGIADIFQHYPKLGLLV